MQAARGASLTRDGPAGPDRVSAPARRPTAVFVAVALLGYLLDLSSKVVAVDALTGRPPMEVVGSLLTLSLTRNPGAAFGTATGYTEVLSVIAILAVVVVVWVARRLGSIAWAVGLGFLLGGVLGNLTDRIFRSPGPLRGHVVDFFALGNFPVFNVADICINLAAAVIVVQALRGVRVDGSRPDRPEQPAPDRQA